MSPEPSTALWWLEQYAGFVRQLESITGGRSPNGTPGSSTPQTAEDRSAPGFRSSDQLKIESTSTEEASISTYTEAGRAHGRDK